MKRAFTLIELMAATVIGSILVLTIAGCLDGTIKAWEAVQMNVSENYNRRSVLDLVKRQSSSIFYRREADALATNTAPSSALLGRNRNNPNGQPSTRGNRRRPNNSPTPRQSTGMQLPQGASFFHGNPQELSFLSTVSFLSDFPGQVAVRYYVVQGQPEDGQSITNLTGSRTENFDDSYTYGDVPESIQGGLYLYLEEKNLFLSTMNERSEETDMYMTDTSNSNDPGNVSDGSARFNNNQSSTNSSGEIVSTQTMKLIGPLRTFNMRYRVPATRGANDADTDNNWAEVWDLEEEGVYPTAIEFTLYYETPGITDDLPTEDLPGIRMVIPVYDTNNLARGGNRGSSIMGRR